MRSLCPVVCLLAAATMARGADGPVGGSPPPVAVKFLALFDRLREAGGKQHVEFALTEAEINEYFKYSLKATPRPGVESVTVKVFPKNYVSTFTLIDFDEVERWNPGTIPKLLRPLLTGKKSVWLDYRFQVTDGKGTFTVEKAYYQDVRLPAIVVGKMIEMLAAKQPEHYDTTKPMPLPFDLRKVWTTEHTISGEN